MGQHTWFCKDQDLLKKEEELYKKIEAHENGEKVFYEDTKMFREVLRNGNIVEWFIDDKGHTHGITKLYGPHGKIIQQTFCKNGKMLMVKRKDGGILYFNTSILQEYRNKKIFD